MDLSTHHFWSCPKLASCSVCSLPHLFPCGKGQNRSMSFHQINFVCNYMHIIGTQVIDMAVQITNTSDFGFQTNSLSFNRSMISVYVVQLLVILFALELDLHYICNSRPKIILKTIFTLKV